MTNVKLIAATAGVGELEGKGPQDVISYVARVSNPGNQDKFETAGGLLRYCIKHEHWSIFETVSMTLEINTTRGIAAQVLRHRSFTFQEFSQRYADSSMLGSIPLTSLRTQDTKNRQNSVDNLDPFIKQKHEIAMQKHYEDAMEIYQSMLEDGVAKECARFVLPLATPTRIYMTGSCRSWVHYINLRSANGTQAEHAAIALQCKEVFREVFPDVADALYW